MSKTALLLIDFQNDYFEGGKWYLEGAEAAAKQAAKLLAAYREQSLPVIHVRHEFPSKDAPFFLAGSEGARHHSSLAPMDGEPVVLKNYVNAFRNTKLKETLDQNSVTSVMITGAMSHMCVDAVTRAANDFGYQCVVVHDACATSDLEFNGTSVPASQVHASVMAALGFAYAKVASTDELMADLNLTHASE